MPVVDPIPYRLRLGVAGPRTLPFPDETRLAVQRMLREELPKLCPQIAKPRRDLPIAFSVISMLAEGADQLVMEEVKKWQPEAWQEALLPFAWEDYQEEYAAGSARDSFLKLLKSCDRVFGVHEDLKVDRSRREEMDAAFADAIHELVESCDVLLVVRDPAATHSFTAQAVAFAELAQRPMLIVNAVAPHQPIKHVPAGKPLKFTAPRDLRRLNKNIRKARWIEDAGAVESKQLFAGRHAAEASQLRPDRVKLASERLFPLYVYFDKIAVREQQRCKRAEKSVPIFSNLAMLLMVISLLWPAYGNIGALFQLVLLAMTLVIGGLTRRAKTRWIEHRFLAERLRTAIFLSLGGMRVTSLQIPSHQAASEWPIRVSQEIESRLRDLAPLTEDEVPPVAAFLDQAWTRDQEMHHRYKAHHVARNYRRLTLWGAGIFCVGLGLTLAEAASLLDNLGTTVVAMAGALVPVIGAAVTGLPQTGELERLEARSRRLHLEFGKMRTRFFRVHGRDALERLLRDIELLTLREVQDWYQLKLQLKLD